MDQIFRKIQRTVNDLTAKPLEVNLHSVPAVKNLYLRLVDTLQDKDKQLQSLTVAYISALSLIAILSIFGHLVTAHLTSNQKENAEVTFTITNMRSLVDTVISQAAAFKASKDSFDDDLINQSLDQLQKECSRIETYGSDAINGILRDPQFELNDRIKKFVKITDDYLMYTRTDRKVEAAAAFTVLTGEPSRVLEINLDLALQQYRAAVMKQIEHSYELQFVGVLIILLVLFLEATFIFRPIVRHLAEYHQHLIKLALTDMLTGLNNRRAFMQLANAGLDYYNRHKKPFALVLMDLDHFKLINDTYGHKVGDLVLQHYSALVQKGLRAHDMLGRIGGEEFAIFLPQTTAEEAMPMIERLRKTVSDASCPYIDGNGENKMLKYSASFGVLTVTSGKWTLDELFIKVDEQLYKAKEQGRNRVEVSKL